MTPPPADRGPEALSLTDVDGVLLCAGVGARLRPLTDTLPKALVPVAGRPIIDYHLEAWGTAGVRRALLVTGYREDQVLRHVGDGARYGLRIEHVTQPERRGSGHALLAAADLLRAPWVLVGYCDVFFGRRTGIWEALLHGQRAKIAAAEVPNAASYGRLVVDAARPWPRLLEIHEKDGIPSPGLVNAGAYLLPRRVVEILRSVPPSPRGEIELTDGVTGYVAEGGQVDAVPAAEWVDVGTLEKLAIATEMARSSPTRG